VGLITVFAAVMAVAVAVLVAAERAGRRAQVVVSKPVASLCFVTVGLTLYRPSHPYDAWVLVALLLCLLGDVFLMFRGAFLAGLASFLLGHLAYVAAFAALLPPRSWPARWAVPLLLISGAAALWLEPHLGRRRSPVLAYLVVITLMVWGASSVVIGGKGPWILAVGAGLFYVSDLAVARDRLIVKRFASRTWGLPAYYLGQLLLALTIGL
jgi:uncharacterized membrane protein YhhN